MLHLNLKKKRAFSLMEVATVVITIGIVATGMIAANSFITKARTASAQALTRSSPINNMRDVEVWLEGSMEDSLAGSIWRNVVGSNTGKAEAIYVSSSAPTASYDAINRVNSVGFDGSDSHFEIDGKFLNGAEYTVAIVEQRSSSRSSNYFIGDPTQNFALGYSSDGKIIHSQGASNSCESSIGAFDDFKQPKVIIFTHSKVDGNKTYVNGVLAGESANIANVSGVTTLVVGKNYDGEIGEVVVFDRAIRDSEIEAIEKYLSEKWAVKLPTDTSDCLTGIITSAGCDHGKCSVSITGISDTQAEEGSGSLDCNQTGYDSSYSVSYTCSSGVFTPSGSCPCASGYSSVSGECRSQCNVTGVTGINNTTVDYTSSATTKNCNATGFNISDAISYNCVGALFNVVSGACDTCSAGYTLSGSACIPITCTIAAASGFNAKSGLAYATSATAISSPCQAGYSGTPTYTCTTTGAAVTSGTCDAISCSITSVAGFNDQASLPYATSATAIPTPCQGGYSGTPTYTCTATGAAVISGSCAAAPTCTITGVTGFNNQASLPYAASATAIPSACQDGYTGSPTYTCTASGAATISGTCTAITCTALAGTGYGAKSGLPYAATVGSGSFACDAGYSGTKTYTCASAGVAADISGTCTAITCTATSGTGYAAQSSLAYAASGSGSFACSTGYSGSKSYTCTSSGVATGIGGTCAAITCTAVAGTGYSAKSGLAYAASGSGSFACNTGYTGSKSYACTSTGAATGIGGTCTAITCTAVAGTGYSAKSGLAYAASGSGSFACNAGYTGSKSYTCTSTGAATGIGGTCTSATGTWSLVATASYAAGGGGDALYMLDQRACVSSIFGKYSIVVSSPTFSGNMMNAYQYAAFDCYCTGASSCTPSCGFKLGTGGGTIWVYRCNSS